MKTKNITIVGGGSAGWMTAATLLNQFPEVKVTLVESPNTPTIGVGESTVAGSQSGFNGIVDWLTLLDIKDSDWMPHCDAIHKLSQRFENWYRKDSGAFHFPFGEPRMLDFDFNDWHLKKIFYPEIPVSDFAESFFPGMACIHQNKSFTNPKKSDADEVQRYSGWSYQFDATKFGIWLKDHYCKAKYSNNFIHIQAEVEETPLDDNGVKYLILDDGQKLEADLFVDCTGFKSLLLTKAFGVSRISIDKYISNNYAWATRIPYVDPETQIVNYTNCTAIENGWIWEIPLWSGMGSGYVFSDKFISSDEALKEFKRELISKGYFDVDKLEYHLIPMTSGIQEKLWIKNTCAIGLSAAFIEPLQSNGLQSIYQYLFTLTRVLSRDHISEWDRREFTTKCHNDFFGQGYVVALNYSLSHRDDTEYWRDIQNRDWPTDLFSLNADGFEKHCAIAFMEKHFLWRFTGPRLNCIATGMHWNPIYKLDPLIMEPDVTALRARLASYIQQIEERKKRWNEEVKDFPSPYKYLKDNIHINT